MANFPVFKLHHKHAGVAADKGDHKAAMHHVGKMLAALKSAPVQEGGEQDAPIVSPNPLRSKLAQMMAAKNPLANPSGGM